MIEVPRAFAASTIAREGPEGEAWIAALPEVVQTLCRMWDLEVEGPPWHGYVALVVPVARRGVELALKVSWIDASSEQEALALRVWAGRGAVRLLDADQERGALLLERLDPERTLESVPVERAAEVAGSLLRRLAVPAPDELRTVAHEATTLLETLPHRWLELGRPFPERVLDAALDVLRQRPGGAAARVVNQDLHYANVLAGEREPWLVIDPKVLAGDPELGVAPLLWNRFDELGGAAGLERRLRIVSDAAELDRPLAREWSLFRMVECWVWALEEDLADDAARWRTLVEWLQPGLSP